MPFDHRAFVINTGDALQAVTRNKLMATYHRVLWNKEERISIPYFMSPNLDFVIDSKILFPEEDYLIKPITWKNFLKNKLKSFKEYNKVEIK